MKKKGVFLVEDHPLYREGIKAILEGSLRYRLAGEAASVEEAVAFLEKKQPEYVLVDLTLGDESGIEVVDYILAHCPNTFSVVVSMHTEIDYLMEALRSGIRGYIVKESAGDQLLAGLDSIGRGNYYIDSTLSNVVVEELLRSPVQKVRQQYDSAYENLTSREQEILRHLAEGLSSREIAEKLFISTKTVENHKTNIMHKLDVHSSVELVRYAAKIGIIDFERWVSD